MFAPCFLRRDDIAADGLVLDKQPCLVQQEDLERGQLLRVRNFVVGPVENVKQQRLQYIRSIAPTSKVEGLEMAERERVLGIIEEEAVLPAAGPAMQALFQFPDDVAEVGDGALLRFQHAHALDAIPQSAFLFEVKSIPLSIAFYQHAEEAKEK